MDALELPEKNRRTRRAALNEAVNLIDARTNTMKERTYYDSEVT